MTIDGIVLTVTVPQNSLALCCTRKNPAQKNTASKYNLKTIDPQRLKEIIRTVHAASDNDIVIDEKKPENEQFAITVDGRAKVQKDGITVKDIVRMISWDTYHDSFIGTQGKYAGMEMHEFTDMYLYGLTDSNRNATKIYVKLVTPDQQGKVLVPSVHRNND